MDNYRQSIEKANRAFGQVEVAEISLLKTKGPVEVMMLNAAGLVEALRLGAIHCYKSFSRREAQELLKQVSQLPSWEGVTAKEVLVMVGQFIDFLPSEWEKEIWQSWASNMQRWELKKLPFKTLNECDIKIFCGKKLSLNKVYSFWRLRYKADRNSVQHKSETLWVGSDFKKSLYKALIEYNPTLSAFIEA